MKKKMFVRLILALHSSFHWYTEGTRNLLTLTDLRQTQLLEIIFRLSDQLCFSLLSAICDAEHLVGTRTTLTRIPTYKITLILSGQFSRLSQAE